VRSFTDAAGARWEVFLGKASWGTLILLFSRIGGGETRASILHAETTFAANAELDAMSDDDLRVRLRDSQPWP
jgi:hypothetical protein